MALIPLKFANAIKKMQQCQPNGQRTRGSRTSVMSGEYYPWNLNHSKSNLTIKYQ